MSSLDDSKEIFLQLAAIDGSLGVKTIIENHDAWSHNSAAIAQLNAALRIQLQHNFRLASVANRIALQQSRLQSLAIPFPKKIPAAG